MVVIYVLHVHIVPRDSRVRDVQVKSQFSLKLAAGH